MRLHCLHEGSSGREVVPCANLDQFRRPSWCSRQQLDRATRCKPTAMAQNAALANTMQGGEWKDKLKIPERDQRVQTAVRAPKRRLPYRHCLHTSVTFVPARRTLQILRMMSNLKTITSRGTFSLGFTRRASNDRPQSRRQPFLSRWFNEISWPGRKMVQGKLQHSVSRSSRWCQQTKTTSKVR